MFNIFNKKKNKTKKEDYNFFPMTKERLVMQNVIITSNIKDRINILINLFFDFNNKSMNFEGFLWCGTQSEFNNLTQFLNIIKKDETLIVDCKLNKKTFSYKCLNKYSFFVFPDDFSINDKYDITPQYVYDLLRDKSESLLNPIGGHKEVIEKKECIEKIAYFNIDLFKNSIPSNLGLFLAQARQVRVAFILGNNKHEDIKKEQSIYANITNKIISLNNENFSLLEDDTAIFLNNKLGIHYILNYEYDIRFNSVIFNKDLNIFIKKGIEELNQFSAKEKIKFFSEKFKNF